MNVPIHKTRPARIAIPVSTINLVSNGTGQISAAVPITNKMLKIEFGLNDIQIWFLFDKLLMGKYDYLYCRNKINKSDLQIGLYVHCEDFGRGKIVKLYSENLMSVHFDNHKLPCMCSQDGYTVFDNKKRKITRL